MNQNFSEFARVAFSFLEDAGFVLTKIDATFLQYEAGQTVVKVIRDPRLGEIDVIFGLRSDKDRPTNFFSLTDLLRMEDADVAERKQPFQVYKELDLPPFLDQLAKDTQRYAMQALAGDRMYFRRLQIYRSGQSS